MLFITFNQNQSIYIYFICDLCVFYNAMLWNIFFQDGVFERFTGLTKIFFLSPTMVATFGKH